MRARHGGDVAALARRAGCAPDDVLDLSANINPGGPPPAVARALHALARDPRALARYPDPRHGDVRAALARRYGVAPEALAIGNGSAALLDALVRALRPQRCVLPVPSFSEYRKALAAHDVRVAPSRLAPPAFVPELAALAERVTAERAALLLLANPNNPTGVAVAPAALRALAARIPATVVAVDEAFVDYAPELTLLAAPLPPNVVVLRSLTKFYAMPGVRVGFAVAAPPLAESIERALPSWPVGTLDARVAVAVVDAAGDDDAIRRDNAAERARLARDLDALGLHVVPGAANFLLCDASARWRGGADALAERLLLDARVAVRACDDYPGLEDGAWFRVAVGSPAASRRLVAALTAALAPRGPDDAPSRSASAALASPESFR